MTLTNEGNGSSKYFLSNLNQNELRVKNFVELWFVFET